MGQAARQEEPFYMRDEYLRLEEQAERKSEYYNGELFAMSGGSFNHSVICVNWLWKLRDALTNTPCVVFDSNMKVEISRRSTFLYPDVMAVCGKPEFVEGCTDILKNPIMIIEVLSPGTEGFDRIKKFAYYQTLPSLREYVLAAQDEARVETYQKQTEQSWIYTVAEGLDAVISLRSLGVECSLREIYHKTIWE